MRSLLTAYLIIVLSFSAFQCSQKIIETKPEKEFFDWRNATVYFVFTDRFNNGNPDNDINFDRTSETSDLRRFMGGDIQGIIDKIEDGYFTDLGINAIWLSPVVEQVHGFVDEGDGAATRPPQ